MRVLLSAYAEVETVLDAINEGYVYKFLTKSCDEFVLRETVEEIVQTIFVRRRNEELASRLETQQQELEAVDWMVQELDLCTPPPVTAQSLEAVLHALPVGVVVIRGGSLELMNRQAHTLLTDRLQVQHTDDAEKVIEQLESSKEMHCKKAQIPGPLNEPHTVYAFWRRSIIP